jgi:hypothetical protein
LIGFSCGAAAAGAAGAFSAALRAPASLFVQPAVTSAVALKSQMAHQLSGFLIPEVLIDCSRELERISIALNHLTASSSGLSGDLEREGTERK